MNPKSLIMIVAALLMLILLSSPSLLSQEHRQAVLQDATPIRLSTDMVSLSVSVMDKKGQAITGLERKDFKIYENGVEQSIDFFSMEEMPVCWGIVLDSSTSMSDEMHDVYQAAIQVVSEGTEKDRTFVVAFNGKTRYVTRTRTGYYAPKAEDGK
jgi:Ca-activated chloride channel homolog